MELLLEKISDEEFKKYLKEFYNYAISKLQINKTPKLVLEYNMKNADDMFGKTGFYNPDKLSIHLFVKDRHPKDVLRSFAHELIHHEQNCKGLNKSLDMKKTATDPAYASHDPKLREMERDAFERGNMLFRDWCDMQKIKRMSVMENKKNEMPYNELFEKKERVLNKVQSEHEDELYKQLLKRYIETPSKEEKGND